MNSYTKIKYGDLQGVKVLIIDDDIGLCNSLKYLFEDHDSEVLTANNGEEGLRIFESFNPDIVLVDLHMPGIGGHVVISNIAKKNPETPIIVVSGTGVVKDAILAMTYGAWEFIQKPILHFDDLELIVFKALEKRELIKENRIYKENLEKLVLERTEKLKQTIEELNIAKEKAERSDRLKSQFLAQISHEIRTPINGIMTSLSILRMELEDRGINDLMIDFDRINLSSERIIRTVELILNMSEVQLGTYIPKFQTVNVNSVVEKILKQFENKIKHKGIELLKQFDGEITRQLDEYSFEQIIANLIDNAYKFTDNGQINVIIDSENLKLKICDTGIGINEEYLSEIFIPFNQEDKGYTRNYDGNGLGLPLSKKYCELNNIDIKINSKKNEGTCIELVFI